MYPEFVYTNAMQLILAIVAFIVNYIIVYSSANLILLVYGEKASVKQKGIFAFFIGAILNTAWSYAVYFIMGVPLFSATVYAFVVNPNPLFAMLYYLIGIKVLKLSPIRSIKLMGHVYLYYMLIKSLATLITSILFIQPPGRYNYLLDVFKNLTIFIIFMFILFVTKIILQYNKRAIKLRDNLFINLRKELAIYFIKSTIIYFVLVCIPLAFSEKIAINAIIFFIFMIIFALFILWDMYIYKKIDAEHKDTHIDALLKKILAAHTVDVSELRKKVNENLSLVSILLNKINYAEKMKVKINIALQSRLDNFYIDNIDTCMVVSCLLDNAIEAAANSEQKIVSFAIVSNTDTEKLIVINNSTAVPVDIDNIIFRGITTKEAHEEESGIATVRKIASKYGNCTFQLAYYHYMVTAYFAIRQI